MPFKKVGSDDYTGPSGKHFNLNQVRLYYSRGGSFPGQKKGDTMSKYAKGGDVHNTSYAAGGPVLGRTVNFMKTPDEFSDPREGNPAADEDQKYAKSGDGAGKGCIRPPAATGKSLKAIKPQK